MTESIYMADNIAAGIIASKPVAWDDTTTTNCTYFKYLNGRIEKIDTVAKTRLTAQSGNWADRATLTYTEGGV